MELNKYDKLYLATAYKKKVDEAVKELKSECDADFLAEFEKSGNTQKRSVFFGKGAGTYVIPINEAVPPHESVSFEASDMDAFEEWLLANPEVPLRFALLDASGVAEWHFNRTGELPDGIDRKVVQVDGSPERPGTPTLRVKADYIADQLKEGLPAAAARLLLGGAE